MIRLLGKIELDRASIVPLYVQIATAIHNLMIEGVIGEGGILPSVHTMAAALDICANTIVKSYEILKKQGLISSMQGKNYTIARTSAYPSKNLVVLLKGHLPCTLNVGKLIQETDHNLLVDFCADIATVTLMPQDQLMKYQKFFLVSENGIEVFELEEIVTRFRG